MGKYLLVLSLFFFFFFNKSRAWDTLLNGAITKPISFPTGSYIYTGTNDNASIGLAASGTGNITSFTSVNTGNSPINAIITGRRAVLLGLII